MPKHLNTRIDGEKDASCQREKAQVLQSLDRFEFFSGGFRILIILYITPNDTVGYLLKCHRNGLIVISGLSSIMKVFFKNVHHVVFSTIV